MSELRPSRGLPSIDEARRKRGRLRWPPAKYWLWAGVVLAMMGVFHYKQTQGEIESHRQGLLTRQRAVAHELGSRWLPMRDKIEGWTTSLANDAPADQVDATVAASWDFAGKPGLYLRLPIERAKDAEGIREGARDSLRDGFTACLLRAPNVNPLEGKECVQNSDCTATEMCNELNHCAPPAQPYNLRVAYRTMRVLSDAWVRDVEQADTDLLLRVMTESFDEMEKNDLRVAADLLTRAKYFLVVLDEPPTTPVDPAAGPEEALTPPHMARVGLWRLEDGKQVLRIRAEANGALLGNTAGLEAGTLGARQRQANACALAGVVRGKLAAP